MAAFYASTNRIEVYHLRNLLQTQLPFMSSAAFLAVGLFAFFVWLKQRREFLYLLFFVVSLSAYLRTMHYYVGQQRLLVSDEWFGWVTVSSLFWLVAAVHFFLVQLHQRPQPWLNRTVIGATAAISIVTLPIISTLLQTTNLPSVAGASSLIYVVLLVMGITAYSFDLRSSWQVKSRDGMLLASWSLLSFLFGVYDWMLQSNYVSIEGSYLGSYANFSAYLIFMSILFRRYIGAIDDVQQINASLAQRLQIRETELTESHQRLRKIEHQQVLAQERQRLTQDMHDGLGSSLVSALRVVEHGRMDETEVAQVLKGCIDDLKLAIDSMESVDADLLLLLATLRFRLGPRLESTGIALRWEVEEVPALDWLDPKNSLHILRILQEAFTNIIKHTRATEIRVATKTEGDFVVVTITDNGLGFALEQALKSAGKGLANQQRRAQAIGGEVSWVSNDAGTSVALRLPIRAG